MVDLSSIKKGDKVLVSPTGQANHIMEVSRFTGKSVWLVSETNLNYEVKYDRASGRSAGTTVWNSSYIDSICTTEVVEKYAALEVRQKQRAEIRDFKLVNLSHEDLATIHSIIEKYAKKV